MEQATDLVGNPLTILIERIFWLSLGGFFGLAIIRPAVLRPLNLIWNKIGQLLL